VSGATVELARPWFHHLEIGKLAGTVGPEAGPARQLVGVVQCLWVSGATVELATGPARPWFHHLEVEVGKLAGAGPVIGEGGSMSVGVWCGS